MPGRIPERTVRDVVEQTDMIAIVGEVVDLRRVGSTVKGLCPFHNEKSPSFTVNPGLKVYHCFGCGAGGDVIRFVRETRGLGFAEAVEYLADRLGIVLQREDVKPEDVQRALAERSERGRMLELNKAAQAFFRERFAQRGGEEARRYAEGRGLQPDIIERFGLGAAGTDWTDLCDALRRRGYGDRDLLAMGLGVQRQSGGLYDRFRNRLMFPIFTAAGDIVGFGGRALGADKEVAKYMNSPETTLDGEGEDSRFKHFYKKGSCVFGLYQAREAIRRSKLAIVCEGNIDVITLHQAGFASAVCPMGTALTEMQAREIKRFADKVALVFDGDAAGRKAAMKAVPVCVDQGLDGVFVVLPDGEDPDSFVRQRGAKAFQELLDNAPQFVTGYIDALLAESDGSLGGNAQVLQKVGPLLSSIADPIARDMARDYLAARVVGRGTVENRETLRGYLKHIVPRAPSEAHDAPPDPTRYEPALDPVDADLAKVLVWYPSLLAEAERLGGIELVRHSGMRLALRDLCGRSRNAELDPRAVLQWAQDLPDGVARRAVMAWLIAAPVVAADRAHEWLDQVLARLQERDLKDQIEQLKAAMGRPGVPAGQQIALAQQKFQLEQNLYALSRSGKQQGAAASATGPRGW